MNQDGQEGAELDVELLDIEGDDDYLARRLGALEDELSDSEWRQYSRRRIFILLHEFT